MQVSASTAFNWVRRGIQDNSVEEVLVRVQIAGA